MEENSNFRLPLPSLYYLTVHKVSSLILKAWNIELEEKEELKRVNKDCYNYFELPCDVCFLISCSMVIQNDTLTFGQSIWILESRCDRLYKRWLSGLNLKSLCESASDKAKNSISEFFVKSDDNVSDLHFAKQFRNLTRLKICGNDQVVNWQVREIITNCHLLQDVSLKGCINLTDELVDSIWRNRFSQEKLRVIDISNTSISGQMAATLYFLLPQLLLLVYDDIESFLRYRCNEETNENIVCTRLIHAVHLGDNGDHRLRYVTVDKESCKEMEISLPNCDSSPVDEDGARNLFKFVEDEQDSFRFQDVYLAMCSIAPHLTFGVAPEKSYLQEISLRNVKNIDLNTLFSHFARIKKLSLRRDCTVTNMESKHHLARSVTDLEFRFVTSPVINKTLRHCPNVEYLRVRRVRLTVDTFKNVTFNLIKLVEFSHCEGYSAEVKSMFPLQARINILNTI